MERKEEEASTNPTKAMPTTLLVVSAEREALAVTCGSCMSKIPSLQRTANRMANSPALTWAPGRAMLGSAGRIILAEAASRM